MVSFQFPMLFYRRVLLRPRTGCHDLALNPGLDCQESADGIATLAHSNLSFVLCTNFATMVLFVVCLFCNNGTSTISQNNFPIDLLIGLVLLGKQEMATSPMNHPTRHRPGLSMRRLLSLADPSSSKKQEGPYVVHHWKISGKVNWES